MENTTNSRHIAIDQSAIFASSRLLERFGFYGIRAILVLYMIDSAIGMSHQGALELYGWFTAGLLFSQVLGAILGDLLMGNRNTMLIGGILQILGAFSLFIPSIYGLYAGLFFIVLGTGFYTPNLQANFGKTLLPQPKYLDAGFSFFYLVVNIGAFLGALILAVVAERRGWNVGFLMAGGLFLLATLLSFLTQKERDFSESSEKRQLSALAPIKLIVAIFVIGLFWASYELIGERSFELKRTFSENNIWGLSKLGIWYSFESFASITFVLIFTVLWSFLFLRSFLKVALGFLVAAGAIYLLSLMPEVPGEQHAFMYIGALLLLGLAEALIAPIVSSIITANANPAYLALFLSMPYITVRAFSALLLFINSTIFTDSSSGILLVIALFLLIGISLLPMAFVREQSPGI